MDGTSMLNFLVLCSLPVHCLSIVNYMLCYATHGTHTLHDVTKCYIMKRRITMRRIMLRNYITIHHVTISCIVLLRNAIT